MSDSLLVRPDDSKPKSELAMLTARVPLAGTPKDLVQTHGLYKKIATSLYPGTYATLGIGALRACTFASLGHVDAAVPP